MMKRILFSAAIIVAFGATAYSATNNSWSKAEKRWKQFAALHLKTMQKVDARTPAAQYPNYRFDRKFVPINHPLIRKFLPDSRVYWEHAIFILHKDGQIVALGSLMGGNHYATHWHKDIVAMDFAAFMHTIQVTVRNAEDVIECVKFTDALYDAWHDESKWDDWKFTALRNDNGVWTVRKRYIGPPAELGPPFFWRVHVNQDNVVTNVTMETVHKIPDFL